MKASTAVVLSGLVTLATATQDHYQNQPDTCPIAKTVTVTQPYVPTETLAPGSYSPDAPPSPYSPGQDYQEAVTVTITESAAPTTVTSVLTIVKSVEYEGWHATTTSLSAAYTQIPYSPDQTDVYESTTSTAYSAKQTHRVEVGTFNGELKFVPNQVNAEIGDVIEYDFLAKSHSLTQSEFLTPCTYNGGFDTGLNQPNPKNESGLFVVPFEVTTKKPQWFYCKQAGPPNHCGKGMVFGLNPGNKMDQFIQNAIQQNGNLAGGPAPTGQIPTPTGAYASATSTASGAVATVTVGLEKGTVLKFDPPYLPKVAVGQTIHFDFRAVNHTLTESSLANPCTKLERTEVDTNFQNVNKDDIPEFKPFDLTIDSDKTRYFYCKQANKTPNGHCSKGMVFAVNIDEATFRQFEQNALATLPKIKGRYAA